MIGTNTRPHSNSSSSKHRSPAPQPNSDGITRKSKQRKSTAASASRGASRRRRSSALGVPQVMLSYVMRVIHAMGWALWAVVQWFLSRLVATPLHSLSTWVYEYPTRVHFRRTQQRYLGVMRSTESYQTYINAAVSLDKHCGIDEWVTRAPSLSLCNAEALLFDTHVALALAQGGNVVAVGAFIRSFLLRNAHGITNPHLYAFFSRPKGCIEDYLSAVETLIEVFAGTRAPQDVKLNIQPCLSTVRPGGPVVDIAEVMGRVVSRSMMVQPVISSQGVGAHVAELALVDAPEEDVIISLPGEEKSARNGRSASDTLAPPSSSSQGQASRRMCGRDSVGRYEQADAAAAPRAANALSSRAAKSNFILDMLQWSKVNNHIQRCSQTSRKPRLELLKETLRAFGRTALILSGGASMGSYHAGVVRALFEANVLPDIFSGSSAGSIIASLICTKHPKELKRFIESDVLSANALQLTPFGRENGLAQKIKRLFKTGFLMDVRTLMECIRSNCGDMTFMEAFKLTGKVLNICVTRDQQKGTHVDRHVLLNYLTSPDVVIWSAVSASCALPGLFTAVQLIEKKPSTGNFQLYLPGELWCDGSVAQDVPRDRLAQLFGANYFIVSQVNPYVIPFMKSPPSPMNVAESAGRPSWFSSLWFSSTSFLRGILVDLFHAGLLPSTGPMEVPLMLLTQSYTGNVTILPIGNMGSAIPDYLNIVNNPTAEYIGYVSSRAQTRSWPFITRIECAMRIERALRLAIQRLEDEINSPIRRLHK